MNDQITASAAWYVLFAGVGEMEFGTLDGIWFKKTGKNILALSMVK
jgi:hypothetical protein